jgi:hypothetical protein
MPDDVSGSTKVDRITTVSRMTSVNVLWRWAVTSQERALANARVAAIECSRRRVERAEVAQFLAAYAVDRAPSMAQVPRKAAATGH